MAKRRNLFLMVFFIISFSQSCWGFEDPTGGNPFLPWLWSDQFYPTFEAAVTSENLSLLALGGGLALASHTYDEDVYQHIEKGGNHLIMSHDTAATFSEIGSGALWVGVAAIQIYFDQKNGLKHGKAIALTSLSHFTLAFLVQRDRPGGREGFLSFPSSFPSGHASSAFASAASLGYSYGWKVGVPAYLLATAVSASRINENVHWLSDVVAGAALGIYWAKSSYESDDKTGKQVQWFPAPVPGGLVVNLSYEF